MKHQKWDFQETRETGWIIQGVENGAKEPPYFMPVRMRIYPGMTASLDMLRLKLHLVGDEDFDRLVLDDVDKVPCDDKPLHFTSQGQRRYTHLFTYKFGDDEGKDATVKVGLGFNLAGSEINKRTGFVEFNPNKVGNEKAFYKLLQMLERHTEKWEVVRFDAALDIQAPRYSFQLVQDRRKYEYHSGEAVTEYLGNRNSPGRVKLYDKRYESQLETNLTRLEITCDVPEVSKIAEMWPRILCTKPDEGLSRERATLAMLRKLEEIGQPIEPFLDMMSKNTRTRYRRKLSETVKMEMPDLLYAVLCEQVKDWCRLRAVRPIEQAVKACESMTGEILGIWEDTETSGE